MAWPLVASGMYVAMILEDTAGLLRIRQPFALTKTTPEYITHTRYSGPPPSVLIYDRESIQHLGNAITMAPSVEERRMLACLGEDRATQNVDQATARRFPGILKKTINYSSPKAIFVY